MALIFSIFYWQITGKIKSYNYVMLLELHKQQQNHKDTIKLFHQLCGKGNPFEETDKFHTS